MRPWLVVFVGTVVALAGAAVGDPPPQGDAFETLGADLLTVAPQTPAEKKLFAAAAVIAGKPSKNLQVDVGKGKKLAKALDKIYGENTILDNDLDAVLDQLDADVSAENAALAKRTADQADGKAKTQAQAKIDAANAALVSARAAADREAKANAIGAALQDVLKGESYITGDEYVYAVVNGEALFATHTSDVGPAGDPYFNADGRGTYFVIQVVGTRDTAPPYLEDVISFGTTGIPKAREYALQDYLATHSRQDNRANAPDGFREIVVPGSDSFVKFLKVDKRNKRVAGIFQYTVHVDGDDTKVDRVRFGSFRVHYL